MTSITDTAVTTAVPPDTGSADGSLPHPPGPMPMPGTAVDPPADVDAIAAAVRLLAGSPDHRVLRRIAETTLPVTATTAAEPVRVGVVVDVETEGIDPAAHGIIELAMRRFQFDALGRIVAVGKPRCWREDPERPLDPAVTRLTGLTDTDLAGQSIDEVTATKVLRSADVVIAHHAAFDRPRVERRLPGAAGRPWACSLAEVPWGELGFESRRLGHLLMEMGWFHDGHRAETDILALLHVLAHRCSDGTTLLGRLIAQAETVSVRVEVYGSPYAVKDRLKSRGYRWDADRSFWWTEVRTLAVEPEQLWLQRQGCRPPRLVPVTWTNRHR